MDRLQSLIHDVPLIDLLGAAFLLAGALGGMLRGLGPVFGRLLWAVMSLWLATTLSPVLLQWMPNTATSDAPASVLSTYGLMAALLLILPVLARLLGGSGGRKRTPPDARDKPFGALVGVSWAALVLVLMLPFGARLPVLDEGFPTAHLPRAGAQLAEWLPWFYPAEHHAAIVQARTPRTIPGEPAERGPDRLMNAGDR